MSGIRGVILFVPVATGASLGGFVGGSLGGNAISGPAQRRCHVALFGLTDDA